MDKYLGSSASQSKVTLRTDSAYVANNYANQLPTWKNNDYKTTSGKPVVNKNEFVQLDKSMGAFKDAKVVIV